MRVSATTLIRATPGNVWAYVTVPEYGPRWQEAAVWTRVRTAGPIRLGSTMDHLGRWLGVKVPTTAVVTVFEPPARFGYDITSRFSRRPSLMRYVIEPTAEGSRLTLSNDAELPRWMRPAERLLRRNVQAMFERDVARLKRVIEAEVAGAASGTPPA